MFTSSICDNKLDESNVKSMYEIYPFPPLSIGETQLISTSSSGLPRYPRNFIGPSQWIDIVHHVFQGSVPKQPVKLLFAGAGTGTSTMLLCNQLRSANINFTAVHFDLSSASIKIATKRAKLLGHSITFVQGSLLNENDMLKVKRLGHYDYIDCVGVLMATVDPVAALRNLGQMLNPSSPSGIGIMIYGKYGRAPIYQIRRTMELLTKGNSTKKGDNLKILRKVLKDDGNHWARLSKLGQHAETYDDISLVDTYLHPVDTSFNCQELFKLVKDAKLHFGSFTVPMLYDATTIPHQKNENDLSSNDIRTLSSSLDFFQLAELGEVMDGTIERHEFYALNAKRNYPSIIDSPHMILALRIPLLYFKRKLLLSLVNKGQIEVGASEAGHRARILKIPKNINRHHLFKVAKQINQIETASGDILKNLYSSSNYKNNIQKVCNEMKLQKTALRWLVDVLLMQSGFGVIIKKKGLDVKYSTWDQLIPKCNMDRLE
jgi:SAM-dependent methyltransferase